MGFRTGPLAASESLRRFFLDPLEPQTLPLWSLKEAPQSRKVSLDLLEVWGKFLIPLSLLERVGLFYLRVSLFYLRLVFVAYGQLAWSFLLTVEIWFGLFRLRWKIGLVFFTYGSHRSGNQVWSFCLRFPPSGNRVWSFLLTVPPPQVKKTNCK